jgi:CBS-domain-containing membrane protein
MREKNIRRLPVIEKDKLVGIVTKTGLLETAPSAVRGVNDLL